MRSLRTEAPGGGGASASTVPSAPIRCAASSRSWRGTRLLPPAWAAEVPLRSVGTRGASARAVVGSGRFAHFLRRPNDRRLPDFLNLVSRAPETGTDSVPDPARDGCQTGEHAREDPVA